MIDRTEEVGSTESPHGTNTKATPPSKSRSHEVHWVRWFALLGGIIGLTSLLVTPPVRASDEFSHLARASSIEQGHLLPIIDGERPVDYPFDGCTRGYLTSMYANLWVKPAPPWGWQFKAPACLTTEGIRALGELRINNTEINSPVAYVPAVVGFGIGKVLGGPVWGVFGARFIQLLASITLMCLAIHLTPKGKPFLFALGLLPAAIQLTGNVSADPVTTGLAFVIVAMTLRMIERHRLRGVTATRLELVVYATLLTLMVLSKTVNAPLILVAILIPTGVFGSSKRRIAYLAATLGVAGTIAAAWSIGVVSKIRVAIFFGADSIASTAWIKAHPIEFAASVLRGWWSIDDVHGVFTELITVNTNAPVQPWWLIFLMLGAVVATMFADRLPRDERKARARSIPSPDMTDTIPTSLAAPTEGLSSPSDSTLSDVHPETNRQRIWTWIGVLAIAFIAFWMIEFGVAISSVPPGAHKIIWVQGRYFIPFAPLALFLMRGASQGPSRRRLLVTAVIPLLFLVALNLWWLSVVARTYYTF